MSNVKLSQLQKRKLFVPLANRKTCRISISTFVWKPDRKCLESPSVADLRCGAEVWQTAMHVETNVWAHTERHVIGLSGVVMLKHVKSTEAVIHAKWEPHGHQIILPIRPLWSTNSAEIRRRPVVMETGNITKV